MLECSYCHTPKDITLFYDWRNIKSDGKWHKTIKGYACLCIPMCKNCKTKSTFKSKVKHRDIRHDLNFDIPDKFASKRSKALRSVVAYVRKDIK